MPAESLRGFFWHGIVWKNEVGEHAFYDVKIRSGASDYSSTTLMTSDLPPLVVREDDTVRVLFLLENSYGLQTVRYKVSEASIKGSQVRSVSPSHAVKPGVCVFVPVCVCVPVCLCLCTLARQGRTDPSIGIEP